MAAKRLRRLCLLAAAAFAAGLLCGCSIDETEGQELLVQPAENEERRIDFAGLSDLQREFMLSCFKCIMGDVSELNDIVQSYRSSRTDPDFSEPLALQEYRINSAFESCAHKAAQLHHFELQQAMVTHPMPAAELAQKFYARGNLTDGAFWLQRTINLSGEKEGSAAAGRLFIQHRSTMLLGARLLEQAARLGDRESAALLLGLTDPFSTSYQNLRD